MRTGFHCRAEDLVRRSAEQDYGERLRPSIKYSELDIYTKPICWEGSQVRIVFQCRQDMKTKFPSLRIEGETIGWEKCFGAAPISRHFPNNEIERYTAQGYLAVHSPSLQS